MDEAECRELIEAARIVHLERGGSKGPAAEEQVTIDFAFATVVTIAPVREGEPFTESNLWVKRPGTGPLLAEHYEAVLGRVAARDIPADTHISFADVK
jgi:N-acetylneuraminate synthase